MQVHSKKAFSPEQSLSHLLADIRLCQKPFPKLKLEAIKTVSKNVQEFLPKWKGQHPNFLVLIQEWTNLLCSFRDSQKSLIVEDSYKLYSQTEITDW